MERGFEQELNPKKVREAEMVVCIPSDNEADSLAHLTTQVDQGLTKYFDGKSCAIIKCNANSSEEASGAFLQLPTNAPKIQLSTSPGGQGKGKRLLSIFKKASDLSAKGVVVVDAKSTSILSEWIKYLGEPLFNNFSFVTPLYVRHKYEAIFTNSIAYPLTRCLYGRRVREPIGGDFGFSGSLLPLYLDNIAWDEAMDHSGIDIWMTTLAINSQGRICQSYLGGPKFRQAKVPSPDLDALFYQVLGSIFSMMQRFDSAWSKVKYSRPTAIHGFGVGAVETPPRVEVDTEKLLYDFHSGAETYDGTWRNILTEDVYKKVQEIRNMKGREFNFPADLWARVLFDTAVSYRERPAKRDEILGSLITLFSGKALSFITKTRKLSVKQAEETIEEECMTFEMTKPYLISEWKKRGIS